VSSIGYLFLELFVLNMADSPQLYRSIYSPKATTPNPLLERKEGAFKLLAPPPVFKEGVGGW
jgi:hypothetical protein